MIVCFEGPDWSGKSTIAKKLSSLLEIPYFKNSVERIQKKNGQTRALTKVAIPFFFDFLAQVDMNVVIDRSYPSEWVYAQVEKRKYDLDILRMLDDQFANMHAVIIICYKMQLDGFVDEITKKEKIPLLVQKYKEFAAWTHVKTLLLETDDSDIDSQIQKIMSFFDACGYIAEL